MQLKKLILIILSLAIIFGFGVYSAIDYLPVTATPAAAVLPKKVEEKPQFLFALGDGDKGKLKQPISLATDEKGQIYVTDAGDYSVKVYLPDGKYYRSFGQKGSGHSGFGYPYGIGFLKSGDLVISDSVNSNVRVFSKGGKYKKTLIEAKQKIRPGALVIDQDGQIYISDLMNHQVLVVTPKGKIVRKVKPIFSSLKYPQELVVNPSSHSIWVADSGNFAVKEINSDGLVTSTVRSWGEPPQAFSLVRGMSIDSLNRLVVADTVNGTVHVMSLQGKELFSIDGKGSPAGNFVYPSYIFVDGAGRIYVADRGTGLVQVWGYKK
ncbi:MAG: NHL repeat-containing protein [Eubacteriales bacterium]